MEAPPVEALQLTREQQRALRMWRDSPLMTADPAQAYWYKSMMFIEPATNRGAPVVPQDVPQLQIAAAAAEAPPRTGGGAGLQQLA